MTRFAFALLATSSLAARVEVHSGLSSFEHLSSADSLAANNALDLLAKLKQNSDDVHLQEEYRTTIGDIEWEEDRAFLATGMNHNQVPMALGDQSTPGSSQSLVELLSGRMGSMSWFTTRLGRLFTGRRDFAVETVSVGSNGETVDGETKYMIDGITRSLHSRMQVTFPNEVAPRFVVRRAFNYLNPIASTAGQYVYRVIRCNDDAPPGWAGGCREGEMLYTITKDRFGRGALWGQDEYRVYTGTGGCRRHGYGVLSCASEYQIMYSLSSGLSSGSHTTTFYAGNIDAIDGDHESGRLHDGTELDIDGLLGMQVATVGKTSGSPRALNYPITAGAAVGNAGLGAATAGAISTAHQISQIMSSEELILIGRYAAQQLDQGVESGQVLATTTVAVLERLEGTMSQTAAENLAVSGILTAVTGTGSLALLEFTSCLAWWYHLAKSLIWADAYTVDFVGNGGSTDELLVNVVAAVQDLTRENAIARSAGVGVTR